MRALFHRFLLVRPNKPKNPLLKMLFAVIGVFLLFGVCIFALFVGVLMLIASSVLKLVGKKAMRPRADTNVLDAEYTVVKKSPLSILR